MIKLVDIKKEQINCVLEITSNANVARCSALFCPLLKVCTDANSNQVQVQEARTAENQ